MSATTANHGWYDAWEDVPTDMAYALAEQYCRPVHSTATNDPYFDRRDAFTANTHYKRMLTIHLAPRVGMVASHASQRIHDGRWRCACFITLAVVSVVAGGAIVLTGAVHPSAFHLGGWRVDLLSCAALVLIALGLVVAAAGEDSAVREYEEFYRRLDLWGLQYEAASTGCSEVQESLRWPSRLGARRWAPRAGRGWVRTGTEG